MGRVDVDVDVAMGVCTGTRTTPIYRCIRGACVRYMRKRAWSLGLPTTTTEDDRVRRRRRGRQRTTPYDDDDGEDDTIDDDAAIDDDTIDDDTIDDDDYTTNGDADDASGRGGVETGSRAHAARAARDDDDDADDDATTTTTRAKCDDRGWGHGLRRGDSARAAGAMALGVHSQRPARGVREVYGGESAAAGGDRTGERNCSNACGGGGASARGADYR